MRDNNTTSPDARMDDTEDEASSSNSPATEPLQGGSSGLPRVTFRPPSRPTARPSSPCGHATPSGSILEATLQVQEEELDVLRNGEALSVQASTSSSRNLPILEVSEPARQSAQAQALVLSSQSVMISQLSVVIAQLVEISQSQAQTQVSPRERVMIQAYYVRAGVRILVRALLFRRRRRR
jgi:hypothetical protein